MKEKIYKLRSSIFLIIIHQTHYEKSDWSRAFNQFTIACELDMINAISAADIAFIMSSSTSACYQAPWSVLLRNRMAEQRLSINVYKDFPLRIFLFQCILYSDRGFIIVF